MLRHILEHEWRLLRSERTLGAVSALFILLVSFALVNEYTWIRFRKGTIAQVEAEQKQRISSLRTELQKYESGQLERKGFLNPRGAASIGGTTGVPYLVITSSPLAALSVGQSDLFPYFFKAGLAPKQTILSNDELENPVNLLSGRFDLSFVMVYLFPLLVLALSYNIISAEKEQGTLALALAQQISLRSLVFAKALIRFTVLVLLGSVLCSIGAILTGANLLNPSVLLNLAL